MRIFLILVVVKIEPFVLSLLCFIVTLVQFETSLCDEANCGLVGSFLGLVRISAVFGTWSQNSPSRLSTPEMDVSIL